MSRRTLGILSFILSFISLGFFLYGIVQKDLILMLIGIVGKLDAQLQLLELSIKESINENS